MHSRFASFLIRWFRLLSFMKMRKKEVFKVREKDQIRDIAQEAGIELDRSAIERRSRKVCRQCRVHTVTFLVKLSFTCLLVKQISQISSPSSSKMKCVCIDVQHEQGVVRKFFCWLYLDKRIESNTFIKNIFRDT